jgi:hypothetical protein
MAWPASAQDAARPSIKSLRYEEDWRALCDPARRAEWLDPLKCIALEPGVTLTFGGELRERFEIASNPDFGIDQGHDHVFLHRLLLHADLRADDAFRAFAQLGAFGESGREGERSTTDLDRADLVQGFVDLSAAFDFGRITGRGGRQEMSFGSSRLISVRDSPNIRRSFDGGRVFWTSGDYRLDTLYVRPVVIDQGTFDDPTNRRESLWGAYGTGPVLGPLKADLYYLGFHRDRGRFAEGIAEEQRHSLGIRLFGAASGFDWDVEGVYQFGDFGGRDIRAWTVASDWGFALRSVPMAPRLGLKADIASGDRDPADNRLGTFNALYPRLPYFSEANLVAPANIIDVQPNVQVRPVRSVLLSVGWNVLWRHEIADAIYAPPLAPIANTAGRGGNFIGSQAIIGAEWRATPNITVASQYVHFWAGDTLQRAGGGDVDFMFASIAYKF